MAKPLREILLPETTLHDQAAVQELTGRVLSLDLPGLIIRQVGAVTPSHHRTVGRVLRPAIEIGDSRLTFPLGADNPSDDRGAHIDGHGAPEGYRQLTLHYTVEGACDLRLHPLLPDLRDKLLADGEQPYCEPYRFREDNLDAELVQSTVHVGHVEAGDMLIFSDSLNVHDFRTTAFPRQSVCQLYYVPLNNFAQ